MTPAQAEAALGGLDLGCGIYFGVDAGIPGLHPLQATLMDAPDVALRLFGDGLEVQALTARGEALLEQPVFSKWRAGASRGQGLPPVAALRGFLACLPPCADALLLGALPFAAHRLAQGYGDAEALGVLFFATRFSRRDAAGNWREVRLDLPGLPEAQTPPGLVQPRPQEAAPEPRDDQPEGGYAGMVARALEWLRDKSLVSLTLSQSYRRRVQLSPAQAFARLRAANPAPASFFLNDGAGQCLFGASPDLQLVVTDGEVLALPVCGTVARRAGAVGEADSLRELINEEVDAASLAVCTDALRNDLAPLCEPGTLRLLDRRRPMSLATVVHAVDRLGGRLRAGADAWDAIVATAAPVMVTGTPRAQALEGIAALEASPRGWYGGMVVQVASNGDALVGTILRAAAVRDGIAEVRTGGDLMADSSPEREARESRLKTLSLWRAFGLEAAAKAQAASTGAMEGTVRLLDGHDPFGNAMRDCLLGMGFRIDTRAASAVVVGEVTDPPAGHAVFVGDAALRFLAGAGFDVRPTSPEHGRPVLCHPTEAAPWSGGPFIAARYASFDLAGAGVPDGWTVWAQDGQGALVMLAHADRRVACLLVRPDSMLSQPAALQALQSALVFAT